MGILETLQAELEELKAIAQAIRDRSEDLMRQAEENDEKITPVEEKIKDKSKTIAMMVEVAKEAIKEADNNLKIQSEAFATMFVKCQGGGVTVSDMIEFAETTGIPFDTPNVPDEHNLDDLQTVIDDLDRLD